MKIGNLTINPNADGTSSNAENNSEQQQGYDESENDMEKKVGPWKRIDSDAPEKEVVERKPEPVATGAASTPSTYIPPSLRNQPPQQPLQAARLRSKAAPDIHNEESFPTLSGSRSEQKGYCYLSCLFFLNKHIHSFF